MIASSENQITFDECLDAKGLNCPLPILKTKVLLNKMKPGMVLLVETTDPHSQVDFEAYCARTEHKIIKFGKTDKVFSIFIERAAKPKKI